MWCKTMGIEDPAGGSQEGWAHIVATYLKYVMYGINCRNTIEPRSKTVEGYAKSINVLFELRGFAEPVDFNDQENSGTVVIHNLKVRETVARQRKELDHKILASLVEIAAASPEDSAERAVLNWVCIGRILGLRAGEYAQKTQSRVEVHTYPDGSQEVKAFKADDFVFYDKNGKRIVDLCEESLDELAWVVVKWRIQKNRQNGQTLKVKADNKNKVLCPVRNLFLAVLRKIKLNHSLSFPVAIYANKGKTPYLTAAKIAEVLRKAVKETYPDILADDLKRYSAHSLRVWAAVLLHEAGKSAEFIQSRLRWRSQAFQLYLRSSDSINQQHQEALQANADAVMALLGENACESLVPSVVSEDESMGEYDDIID